MNDITVQLMFSDAPQGLYKLKVEFDNWDIDTSQEVRWFNVS